MRLVFPCSGMVPPLEMQRKTKYLAVHASLCHRPQHRTPSLVWHIVWRLSNCIFEWDEGDVAKLRQTKKTELTKSHCQESSASQISAAKTTTEMALHCRRTSRGVEVTKQMIQSLLDSMWELTYMDCILSTLQECNILGGPAKTSSIHSGHSRSGALH